MECGIKDISPLKYLVNLEKLYLDYNKITDISSIENLSKLKVLWMDGNEINNKEILKKLNIEDVIY